MRPIVFVGPTPVRRDSLERLGAERRPPVREASLDSVPPGRLVAIIDGELPPGSLLPVSEVEAALDRGVVIYGAASIGAYLASTCARQGMRGIGWVYGQYRAGRLSSFNEIEVVYDPFSLQALSVPLVNVIFWLQELVLASAITPRDARAALEEVRQISVCDRDVASIKACLKRLFNQDRGQQELMTMSKFPDVKAQDAEQLLVDAAKLLRPSCCISPSNAIATIT